MNNKDFNVEKFYKFVYDYKNITHVIMTARQVCIIQDFNNPTYELNLGKLILKKECIDINNPKNSNEVTFILNNNEYITAIFE